MASLTCTRRSTVTRAHYDARGFVPDPDRLEEHLEAVADYDALNAELIDANQRAESWREEAMAVQRQLDMVRG